MSSVLMTSTMNSPPLDDCVTLSLVGGWVSAASCAALGSAALRLALGATPCACAAAGVSAAAPTRPAPFRKLRRASLGECSAESLRESLRRLAIGFLLRRAPIGGIGAAYWLREVSRRAGSPSRRA